MLYQFAFLLTPESHSDATMFTRLGRAYTPLKKKNYQSACLSRFQAKEPYQLPLLGPLVAFWVFYIPRPQYLAKRHPELNLPHHTKPDSDGLVKVPQDLIQTGRVSHKVKKSLPRLGIIENDSQITLDCIEKCYVKKDQQPHIRLTLWIPTKPSPMMQLIIKTLALES